MELYKKRSKDLDKQQSRKHNIENNDILKRMISNLTFLSILPNSKSINHDIKFKLLYIVSFGKNILRMQV